MPSTDIAIRDMEGRDPPLGQPGELCIKGPQVMAGYWNKPEETANVMTADGYPAHRRHRPDRRARLHLHRRPEEGHDPRLRLQRLSERDRRRGDDASRRARGRRGRSAGREVGRSGQDRGRAQGRGRHRRRDHRPLPRAPDRLQDAAPRRVPRHPAALADRQDPAPRAEGEGRGEATAEPEEIRKPTCRRAREGSVR